MVDAELSLEEVCKGTTRRYRLDKEVICTHCGGKRAEPKSKWQSCPSCGGKGFEERVSSSFFARFVRRQTCTACQGRGEIPQQKCRVCRGEGKVRREVDVTVEIPPGMENGQQVRVRGKGNAGSEGGTAGDLFVTVHVKKGQWLRKGRQLFYDLKIPFTTAVLGGKAQVPTLEGREEVTIRPGTAGGERIVLPGRGLPPAGGGARGDLILRVQIDVPTHLSRRQRQILEQLRREGRGAI
jgi:molecular chaperone DnaJ